MREDFDLDQCVPEGTTGTIAYSSGLAVQAKTLSDDGSGWHGPICSRQGTLNAYGAGYADDPEAAHLFLLPEPATAFELHFLSIDAREIDVFWGDGEHTFARPGEPVRVQTEPITELRIAPGFATYQLDSMSWTPVPEPGAGLLLALGLGLLALRNLRWWRRGGGTTVRVS